MVERRREARLAGQGLLARVRPGHRLALVDVSAGGALLEGRAALRPGSRVDLQFETETQSGNIGAVVTRCSVSALGDEQGVTYRSALAFGEKCDWVREAATRAGYAVHSVQRVDRIEEGSAGDELPANET